MKRTLTLLLACMMMTTVAMNVAAGPDDDVDGDSWSENDGDCDDNDPSIYPGAEETDDDGIDSDCDGEDNGCDEQCHHDMFDYIDADQNGEITQQEYEDMFCADSGNCTQEESDNIAMYISLYDADNSGTISWDEYWAMVNDDGEGGDITPEQLLAMWDADEDGSLDLQEIIDGINSFEEDPMTAEDEEGVSSLFDDVDDNSDGLLNIEEFTNFFDAINGEGDGPTPEELLEGWDGDEDGSLSLQEIIDGINFGNSEQGAAPLTSEEEEQISSFFDDADEDEDGLLDLDEFIVFLYYMDIGEPGDGQCPFEDENFCAFVAEYCDATGDNYDPTYCGTEAAHYCADGADDSGCDFIATACENGDLPPEICDPFTNFDHSAAHDEDGDGTDNEDDLCPNTDPGVWANNDGCAANQLDDDADGVSNADDECGDTEEGASVDSGGCTDTQRGELDDDDDSVINADDLCPNTDSGEWADEDGCADNQLDDDGDGLSNADDSCPDEDGTGYDTDGDGCLDDSDADGVTDDVDVCPNTDSGVGPDDNGCADNQLDDDGDGTMNDADICVGHDDSVDTDGDGESDGCDADKDGDGVADGEWGDDAFPLDATESVDTDGDGTGDNADTDDDGDGVADADDAFQLDATESADADGDGIGDNADPDDDNDGVNDGDDDCLATPAGDEVGDDGCEPAGFLGVPGFLGVFAITSLLVAAAVSRRGMSRISQD